MLSLKHTKPEARQRIRRVACLVLKRKLLSAETVVRILDSVDVVFQLDNQCVLVLDEPFLLLELPQRALSLLQQLLPLDLTAPESTL